MHIIQYHNDDKEVALAACRQNGLALDRRSDCLKDDIDVAYAAAQNTDAVFAFGSARVINEEKVALAAVQNNEDSLSHASDDITTFSGKIFVIVSSRFLL